MDLPIKIEGILFRKNQNNIQFLLLKRSEHEGGYWQPLTGGMKEDESLIECLRRELYEETGIKNPRSITPQIYAFSWSYNNQVYLEFVYGVELTTEDKVILSNEHCKYGWYTYEDAVSLLKYQSNKEAFEIFFTLYK